MEEKRSEEDKIKNELTELQEKIAQITGSVDEKKNHIMEILNNRASTKAQIQKFDTMMEQIQVRKSQINREILANDSEIAEENESLNKFQMELKVISDKIISLNDENKEYERRIRELQTKISKESQKLQIGQSAFHREQSRLESLKNITERYDGYGNSIRKVMDNKDREQGLLGVVADIVKVEKDYEIAIETALGGNIQNIVTEDEDTAKRMIHFLKKNKFGRATFLPLTSIRANSGINRPEVLKETGVIGTANKLIQVESKYKTLADYLLGRTLVVDHIDHATMIARKYHQSIRIVTLEGELINPGGSMTGGAFKNSSNLLSRRREIEEFEKTDAISTELQKAYVVQNTAKMNADQSSAKIQSFKQQFDNLRNEAAKLDTQINEIMDNQESINIELDTSESLENDLNINIEKEQKELEEIHAKESFKTRKSEQIHLEYAGLEQKYTFITKNITRICEEVDKFRTELEELTKNKGGNSREITEKEEKIQELKTTIDHSGDLFEEIKLQIEHSKSERMELNKRHKAFFEKREEISKHMADLDKEVYRLESQKEGCEEASEKQINYMWEEYELTLNHAKELRNPNLTDLADMKRRIQELKSEIRALGNVNVNAIEEYKSVSERYEFLKGQHDDLVEAAETLEQIIEELDNAMRKQFKEQFARIAAEFDQVFKEMFGGGKGTLELMEDEDILEAGIRIIAQPPGKKLQNMMQLSGGEKALTAIALLFAIQNLKPSPFCLLDEIEAALDDNNVDRFAQYLHKLTKYTQFIVITHRRGTMTAADRLYGITMQEKGVSTLVSVSLLENELDK